MKIKYTNQNLSKVALKTLELLEIFAPINRSIFRSKNINNNLLSININDIDKDNYFYTKITFSLNIKLDASLENGYELAEEGETYVVWGYLNADFTEFIVDDFSYTKNINGKLSSINFFRDVVNTMPADEYTKSFYNKLINSSGLAPA